MKVFLSWSDQTSRKVASALGDWLPYVIQAIEPFISSENIDKGARWSDELMKQLNETSYGIICVTRQNMHAAWLNFEAGAISKAIERSSVSPFLFGFGCSQLDGPLEQFQFTQYGKEEAFNREDIFKLVSSINNNLESAHQVPHERLRRQFDMWWDELKSKLDDIANNQEVGTVAGLKWLFLPEDMALLQERYPFKLIWIITDELFKYSLSPNFKDIVLKNMEKGIEYVYVIPDSTEYNADAEELKRVSQKAQQDAAEAAKAAKDDSASNFILPKVQRIPVGTFDSSAATDYIIMNPHNDDHSPLRMFLELPVPHRYWVEIDFNAAENFVARFRELAEGKVS